MDEQARCPYCEVPLTPARGPRKRRVCDSVLCRRAYSTERSRRSRAQRRNAAQEANRCTKCVQRARLPKRGGGYYAWCLTCRRNKARRDGRAVVRRVEQRAAEEAAVREADLRVAAIVRERTADVVKPAPVRRRPAGEDPFEEPDVLEL